MTSSSNRRYCIVFLSVLLVSFFLPRRDRGRLVAQFLHHSSEWTAAGDSDGQSSFGGRQPAPGHRLWRF